MPYLDSVDKIVRSYFALVTSESFTYKGVNYDPKTLRVSEGLFRGYTCPAHCGGCCLNFSLDYLPTERHPYRLAKRQILFNGYDVEVWSDLQENTRGHFCHNLSEDARCRIHGEQPFACDFELIRSAVTQGERPNRLTTRLFGRGWAFKRLDGGRGALCEITPVTKQTCRAAVRKLKRLKEWTDHFRLRTRLDSIIKWVAQGPHNHPEYF